MTTMYQCILPFSRCLYSVERLGAFQKTYCDDIQICPGNSDARCFRVVAKKNMILLSLIAEPYNEKTTDAYFPLPVITGK